MSHINLKQKNYKSSTKLTTYGNLEFEVKAALPKEFCLASEKQNNNKISLHQFMENQEKKHLSTKFNKKEVDDFLKEKNAAMEEINIDEDIPRKIDIENNNVNNLENNENNKNNVNNIIINSSPNDNKSSHILIFKGTFGNDEYNRIMNQEHKHHHHHHDHHHHHHHHHHHNNNNNAS